MLTFPGALNVATTGGMGRDGDDAKVHLSSKRSTVGIGWE